MIESSISPAYCGILEMKDGVLGQVTYGGTEYIVDRGGIATKDEPCHVDYAFPFTCKCNGRCEGEQEEQPDYGKHGGR